MSFEVGVIAHFSAEHHLVGDFGPASEPHGHAYRVDVSVSGDRLRSDGTLFDITVLEEALSAVTRRLDGHDLSLIDELSTLNPTAEVVAEYIFGRLASKLSDEGLARMTVRVWESSEAYASYSAEIATTSRS